jgi:hypothetical protein
MPTILLKKSDTASSVPTTSQLTNLAGGVEVAVNTADKRMYTMNSSSAVVELGTNPSSLSIANNASINILTATTATITTLNGTSANITTLTGTSATITNILDGVGNVRNIPASSSKNAAYTLATTDIGTFILTTSGTITVPNNTFAAGNAVSVFNNSASTISLTISTTTGYIGGTNTNRTGMSLATRGVCTVLFVNPSLCVVTGNVT